MLEKRTSHAFSKDIYLVGKLKGGDFVWLEEPTWDCGWYWGFGYMETYTNNRSPGNSRDISSHSHWGGFLGKVESYDFTTKQWKLGEYRHHINESDLMSETVLTEKESWKISDLMKSFYTLKEAAEVLGRGNSNLTTDPQKTTQDVNMAKQINEVILPAIFKEVLAILSPKEDED